MSASTREIVNAFSVSLEDDPSDPPGFQVRYRYELAPLSDLYIVYQRGGYEEDPIYQDATSQLHRSFGLRDEDELLVKLAYRFEL